MDFHQNDLFLERMGLQTCIFPRVITEESASPAGGWPGAVGLPGLGACHPGRCIWNGAGCVNAI